MVNKDFLCLDIPIGWVKELTTKSHLGPENSDSKLKFLSSPPPLLPSSFPPLCVLQTYKKLSLEVFQLSPV